MLNRAYVYTVQKHGTQKQASGDPYFSHPIEVAGLMTDLKLDQETIVTALLHDTVEDTLVTIEDIEKDFRPRRGQAGRRGDQALQDRAAGRERARRGEPAQVPAGDERGYPRAAREAWRIACTTCARCTSSRAPRKRRRIARETMDIYAPLAERVGMYEYMREMQLLAFEQLEPEGLRDDYRAARADQELEQDGQVDAIALEHQAGARRGPGSPPKSGAARSTRTRSGRRWPSGTSASSRSPDIFAFRVLTEKVEDCYRALGVLHQDVAVRARALQGLHLDAEDQRLPLAAHHADLRELDARRGADPHQARCTGSSEFGLAAHWAYKQGEQARRARSAGCAT